ncbi:MAG: C10 family peptidase [Bacteroidales bacterium]|nr:C10 family peptidase [Bacteroidales bacterium]HQP05032.1 C10 family peptidase [Bacteroidales bacterium]
MKHLVIFLALVFSTILSMVAAPVNEQTARRVACNFMNHQAVMSGKSDFSSEVASLYICMKNEKIYYYTINFEQGGFVIISGDDATVPVLAYSLDESFDPANVPPAAAECMSAYEKQYELIWENNTPVYEPYMELWANMLYNDFDMNKSVRSVSQLLTTRWNQDYPYNMFCPYHMAGPGEHCYAGCVATAMGQVMKYYNYPATGRFTKTYFWGDYFTVDFGATTYRWDEMTNVINNTSKEAIAELLYHCGVASEMNYGPDGSGTQLEYAWFALKQYFRYRPDCKFLEKDDFTNADWKFLLKQDLDMAKPLIYRGTNDYGEGHAFVCDGYQDTSYFHFNFGWGGYSNGFYYLDDINPHLSFYWGQAAIFNLNPYDAEYCNSMVYDQQSWTVTDGSGPNYYWNNSECSWLIAPGGAEKIDLHFAEMNTEEGKDIVYVYDGVDENAPLLGSFSGFSIPTDLHTTGGTAFIKFVTDSQNQFDGWSVEYAVNTTSIEANSIGSFGIVPNPASKYVEFKFGNDCSSIAIENIQGKKIQSFETDGNTAKINIENLTPGIYIVTFNCTDNIYTRRLVVQ